MNKRLAKYEQRKDELIAHCEGLLDEAEQNGGEMSAAAQRIYDRFKVELQETQKKIDLEKITEPAAVISGPAWDSQADPLFQNQAAKNTVGNHGMIGAKFRDLFGQNLNSGGFTSRSEFMDLIYSGMSDPRLSALNEGSGSAGGFLTPTAYAAEMLDAAMENSIVMPRARIYPMQTDTKKIAGFDASTNTSGTLFGGIESQWLAEEGTASVTNPDVRQITLKAKKLALLCTTSNELLADGMNISGQLNEGLSTANSWFLDYAFLRGTGAGQPLGVLNDPALVSVAEESEQDSDSIVYENLTKMLARLHPGCFQNAVWIANPTCIPELLQMSYTVGVAGSHVKVLDQLPDGWRMLTRPVLFTEKLPTLGDKGDIMLVDFSQYAIGLRKEITIEKSGHVYFTSDKTAWRAITRIDGQGRWDGPFTPANGDTQSWCVCLDARE